MKSSFLTTPKLSGLALSSFEMSSFETSNDPILAFHKKFLGKELSTSPERLALTWKFNELDYNKNGKLSKNEISGEKRIMLRIFKPISCVREFFKICDVN